MRRRLPALPPAPTAALPGTPEKVAVLRERARLRQALWHPRDATLTDADRFRVGRLPFAGGIRARRPNPKLSDPSL